MSKVLTEVKTLTPEFKTELTTLKECHAELTAASE
jgi:hypothetical protein